MMIKFRWIPNHHESTHETGHHAGGNRPQALIAPTEHVLIESAVLVGEVDANQD